MLCHHTNLNHQSGWLNHWTGSKKIYNVISKKKHVEFYNLSPDKEATRLLVVEFQATHLFYTEAHMRSCIGDPFLHA